MADKIKNFFKKKKVDAKFKMAGPGHKLSESTMSSQSSNSSKKEVVVVKRSGLSEESKVAADAALARLQQKRENPAFNTSLAAIQAQVRKELENEQASTSTECPALSTVPEKKQSDLDLPRNFAAAGVFFKCPLISNDILPRDEWKANIKKFLYEQLEEERGLTACLLILSCNNNREKVDTCVETLCKYLENIVQHPDEEKYQKIRMSNRAFCDRVQPMEGAMELLFAAGFRQQKIKNPDGAEEDYLVFGRENVESIESLVSEKDGLNTTDSQSVRIGVDVVERTDRVKYLGSVLSASGDIDSDVRARISAAWAKWREVLIDALRTAEPIQLELDRNLQVLLPSQAACKVQLPPSFYALTPEEIKREQQLRMEAIERSQMLRTKAMREKDEIREMRKYKFAIIRVRFPDGILLQGTFSVYERYNEIHEFVQENLEHSGLPFVLNSPTGHKLIIEEDANKTLIDLRLVPTSVLTFAWHPSVLDDINNSPNKDVFLKPEVMVLVQEL